VTAFRWLLDGAPQVVYAHRPDVFLITGYSLTQQVEVRAMGIEVSTHGNHYKGFAAGLKCSCQHILNEGLLFRLIATEGEQLFKLIDHKQDVF
jgi:hypothetical protein